MGVAFHWGAPLCAARSMIWSSRGNKGECLSRSANRSLPL